MAPRHRASAAHSNSNDEGNSPGSSGRNKETSDPLLTSPKRMTSSTGIETIDLPVSSSVGMEWTSEVGCSYSDGMRPDTDGDVGNEVERLMDHDRHEDRMTEVELWQHLEHELYDRTESEEADVANEIRNVENEIREEEEAAIAEVSDGQPESSSPDMKEAHRFFPAGKIMHIVTHHHGGPECESGSPSSSASGNEQPEETRVGIFLTPRSLYSKLRLSQTMISDHFMPVYRRQIEKLIKELEEEIASTGDLVL